MQLAVVVSDRDIFARRELVRAEAEARLVVLDALGIVVEDPAGVLGPARLVDQATDLVVLALPEPAYPATIPILVPELRVDMADRVKRRDELVAMREIASSAPD
jgi:hypothetical protein